MTRIARFYHFAPVADPEAVRQNARAALAAAGVKGTLLIAREGLNGTLAGPPEAIAVAMQALRAVPGFAALDWTESEADDMPFARLKVLVKAEIVTMGAPEATPSARVGTHVAPADWNDLIQRPDVTLIDTRNDYEVALGSFAGAIDPGTRRFRDFPAWWAEHGARFGNGPVAMFCTGGIRCEKATSFLLSQGVDEVYHLEGGILGYLETVPEEKTLWRGECFVFDGRISVGHGMRPGKAVLCHACRRPLRPEDTRHPDHEPGVSCRFCAAETSAADKARYRERQRQMRLAQARGLRHLGPQTAS
ncbi:rhodanese-related sulfurtransferase [Rhodosalinus halophilus]|uniref:tRNA uridine(34) hydroxylase n=1 Tax=Rhodosalinus halophilus TaxID=2259333 RepID=A0A365U3Q2_9RHOB|nr:rhodanese-related sulfurtransferase [Rhodosalinus halophilus]RBI82605.1 rhodanese-related sulfurtransferase [Rhodosalinus halophilus]